MVNKEFELIVSQAKRPIWCRILASLFFTFFFYAIFSMCVRLWENDITDELIESCGGFMKTIGYTLPMALYFSITKTILIDTDKDKLISRYCVGPFSFDSIDAVPQLEYVAVFKNSREVFEVNLWYKGNKHYNMYMFEKKPAAMKFAADVSTKLNIDQLDATEKGNSRWIDKISTNE